MMQIIKTMDLSLFCLIILGILIAGSVGRDEKKFISNKLFLAMLFSTAIMLVLDFLSVIADGKNGQSGRIAVLVINTLYYCFHPLPGLLYILYVSFRTHSDYRRLYNKTIVLCIIYFFMLAFTLINIPNGYLFFVDGENRYVRGNLFPLYIIFTYLLILYIAVYVLYFHRKIDRRDFFPLLFFPFPTLLGGFLQLFFYGTSLLWTGNTISTLIVFFHIQNRKLNQDYLTGAFNRRFLDEYLEQKIRNMPPEKTFAGLFIDLDNFKKLNDRYGHSAGDEALMLVVNILKSSVREADFVARFAGDEFVVILDTDDIPTIEVVMGRIHNSIEQFNTGKHRQYSLGLSIGSALFDRVLDKEADGFLKRIDALMYEHKPKKSE